MLIEELIRLGRPVLESGLDPRDVLHLITDAADDRVKNFYRHVIVVELPAEGSDGEPAVLPVQNWQVEQTVAGQKKPDIDVDVERALGAPFSLPAGGNPLQPQGRYGLPVYPIYDPHFQGFCESADKVYEFLAGRRERTPSFRLPDAVLTEVAKRLHAAVAPIYDGREKWLGVLVLARCEAGGFYRYGERDTRIHVGRSVLVPGRCIEPDGARIADALWAARVEEGAAMGRRDGPCSITGTGEATVAAYCKAWPWAFPTWTCPVPQGGNTDLLVEGIGLSETSYRALTLGANLFHGLTRKLHRAVSPELFAPVENRDRQNAARSRSKLPAEIFGSALLLPLVDATLADPANRDDFARRVVAMLNAPSPSQPLVDRYLTSVTGFDVMLPEELDSDAFRLTLVYFSGDVSRGDVHLRAYIQDVLPSTAARLKKAVRPCREQMDELLRAMSPNASSGQQAYLAPRYQSVPYLLARGYGGSHLWTLLEECLHRRPLDNQRVVSHVAARMRSLVPRWPDSRFDVIDEVIFLLVCRDFLHRYNREVAIPPKEDSMPMRPWQDLIRAYERDPIDTMEFTVAELGFACGLVLHRFSGWYTFSQGKNKDFLKHRVLTFGSDLGAKDVVRALGTIRTVAAKFDDLRGMVETGQLAYYPTEERKQHLGDYQRRLGVVLNAVERYRNELEKKPDEFMTGFWSGYCLQGYDRPRTSKTEDIDTKGGE